MIDEVLLAEVRAELAQKAKAQIEAETADRWGARAIVAYERYADERDAARAWPTVDGETKALCWFAAGVEYEHEAIEHAGEAGTVDRVREAIDKAKRALGL
jgi:hypothetical protein